MFTPLGVPRKLPFPLYNQETNGNTTDDLGLTPNDFIWPEDPEERTVIPFLLSQREFTAILSSVDVGADIAYPEQYIEVYWLLVRSLRYRVSICEAIIDCVNNDADVQNAIAQMLTTNQLFNQFLETTVRGLTEGQITGKLIAGECDRPVLAGKIKAIVDAMDQANKDWFEKIEVGTNDEEKFALALEAIPVVGELPFDQVIEFGEDILEDFTENYNGQVDAELLQEWYCGLLCVAEKNADCSISYGEIYEYFANRTASGLNPFSALSDVIGFIRTGDFSGGTKVADGTMMLQAGLVANGREFMSSSLPTIGFATRDAPTSTFYEDCEECPEDDLWLTSVFGGDSWLELISADEDSQTWKMTNIYTGNYLTGGAVSANGTPFYILNVSTGLTDPGNDARFVLDYGTIELDQTTCYYPTDQMWIYNAIAGSEVTVTISRQPCPVWEPFAFWPNANTITQTATSIHSVVKPTEPNDSFSGASMLYGLKFQISSLVATETITSFAYYDAAGVQISGIPPNGTIVTKWYGKTAGRMDITITGTIVP